MTGAGGYLGGGLCDSLSRSFDLRLMDLLPFQSDPHTCVVGDVAELEAARSAVRGVDGVVIAHMASRQAGAYETPVAAFDGNVKGTANLLFAALECAVRRVVLISSCGVMYGHPERDFYAHDLPPKGIDLYGLTKQCQEVLAEFFHREHQLEVAVLRIGGLLYEDTMVDKYGKSLRSAWENTVDPNDVGEAARLAMGLAELSYETLFVMGVREASQKYDVAYTEGRLGWQPVHRFGT